jgi:hypothetical protein
VARNDNRAVLRADVLRKLVLAVIFVASFAMFVQRTVSAGVMHDPPETGDGHDYDAIAYNVWQGRGFGYYWSDPGWREPYRGIRRFRLVLRRKSEYYPTTYRPPAMPYLLSAVYSVAGRNFGAWRVVNCAIMAGAVTTGAIIAAQFGGIGAAVAAATLALFSPHLTYYSQRFLTEALATLLLALVAFVWVRAARDGWTVARAVTSGVMFGALLAARSIFVLSLPVVLLLPGKGAPGLAVWRAKALCIVTALVVISPWWIRNIMVTDAFMPLGTQGGINLPMGFGPRALASDGIWRSNPEDGWPEIAAQDLGRVESEVQLAKFRTASTLGWMRDHPIEVTRLMGLHVWQEIRPRGDCYSDWLLPAAVLAVIFMRNVPGVAVLGLIAVANVAMIAMTYSAGGRFMVPLEPPLVALVGGAIAVAVVRLRARVVGR